MVQSPRKWISDVLEKGRVATVQLQVAIASTASSGDTERGKGESS